MTHYLVNLERKGEIAVLSLNRAERLGRRLEAEREAFVKQIETNEASNGIDKFLNRQES